MLVVTGVGDPWVRGRPTDRQQDALGRAAPGDNWKPGRKTDLRWRRWVSVGVQLLGQLGAEDVTDAHGGPSHVLVLPNPEDPPSKGDQMSVGFTIPLDVACELRCPPGGVVRG